MTFLPFPEFEQCHGTLTYDLDGASFLFDEKESANFSRRCDVLFGRVSIGVDINNRKCIGCDGYTYYLGTWILQRLSIPKVLIRHALSIRTESTFQPGASYEFHVEDKTERYDVETGWYCVGRDTDHDESVEFANGCVMTFRDTVPVALWLHPQNWVDISAIIKGDR